MPLDRVPTPQPFDFRKRLSEVALTPVDPAHLISHS